MSQPIDAFTFLSVTVILVVGMFWLAFTDAAYIRNLQRRVGQLESQVQWQPMSTAPKDGTPVHLGFTNMHDWDVIAHWSDGDWSLSGDGVHATRLRGRPAPSGWKHLPDPPIREHPSLSNPISQFRVSQAALRN